MMRKRNCLFVSLTLAVFVLSALGIYSRGDARDVHKNAAYYNEKGMAYFNKGFYDELPRGKKEAASQDFERAVIAFKEAIALNKDNLQARRNLARVYYVQKRYLEAAQQYQKVTDLDPSDIDTYVITALAYTKAKRYAEAIEQLKIAKTFTVDKVVIQKLDGYIAKIEQEKPPE